MEMYLLEYDNGQDYDDNDHYVIGLFTELDLAVAYAKSYLVKIVSRPYYKCYGTPSITISAMEPNNPDVYRAVVVLNERDFIKK